MHEDLNSYTCANSYPTKIVSNEDIIKDIKNHSIKPHHIQLNPTNRCPLNCSFCSCSKRDKLAAIERDRMEKLIPELYKLGVRAITISGGGEPLAYPDINWLFDYIKGNGMESGLVTNAALAENAKIDSLNNVTWCRISLSTEGIFRKEKYDYLRQAKDLDLAFSLVVTSFNKNNKDDVNKIINIINYANDNKYTHIRIINDILNVEKTDFVSEIRESVHGLVDDSSCIYQTRTFYQKGAKRCLWSLLRPVIDATGAIIPCCGVQYAQDPPSRNFTEEFKMCTIDNMEEIFSNQKFFDGSKCQKCYYYAQNDFLNTIWDSNNIKHKNFI